MKSLVAAAFVTPTYAVKCKSPKDEGYVLVRVGIVLVQSSLVLEGLIVVSLIVVVRYLLTSLHISVKRKEVLLIENVHVCPAGFCSRHYHVLLLWCWSAGNRSAVSWRD